MERDELAKLLIGRPGRLRLAGWILHEVALDGYFYQDAARKETGDVINEVRQNLQHFETLGLIKTAYRDRGPGRRLYYQRMASPVWAVYEAALAAVEALERGNQAQQSPHRSSRPGRLGGAS